MRSPISWSRVAAAVHHYVRDFRYVEVPWTVSEKAVRCTLPPDRRPFKTLDGILVGSAEQSFIQMSLDGVLEPGRYVAVSPCFRDDMEDELHCRHFLKVELILLHANPLDSHNARQSVRLLVDEALQFFRTQGCPKDSIELVNTREGYDIELGGVEIGSYGYREVSGLSWTYGTGLAEPRFSTALSLASR